jgi:hypothetical protein
MTEKKLSNEQRNSDTTAAIKVLKEADHGSLSIKPSGIAQATAFLNVAESLQMLQEEMGETSAANREALKKLQSQISGLSYVVGTTIEAQAQKMIASNERLAASNEYYAKWNKRLSAALITVTLVVGMMQAYVVWRTAAAQTSPRPQVLESQSS